MDTLFEKTQSKEDYSQQIESLIEKAMKFQADDLEYNLTFYLKHPSHEIYFTNYIKSLLKDFYQAHSLRKHQDEWFIVFLLNTNGAKIYKDIIDFKRRLDQEKRLKKGF